MVQNPSHNLIFCYFRLHKMSSNNATYVRNEGPAVFADMEPTNNVAIYGGRNGNLQTTTKEAPVKKHVLPLQPYHVILGRYNDGKKTKPLTPAVEMYKKARSQTKRAKNPSVSKLRQIKHETTALLQEELAYGQPPLISFWVDVHKASQAGKLAELKQAHPQLRSCKDFDGEQVTFVQDHDDFFLRADLESYKPKRKGIATKEAKKVKSLTATLERTNFVSRTNEFSGVGDSAGSTCLTTACSSYRRNDRSSSVSDQAIRVAEYVGVCEMLNPP